MKESKDSLDRLLRSAAQAGPGEDPAAVSAPFGFDTRVVALWRSGAARPNGNGLNRLLRRVALVSAVVLLASGVAAVRELQRTNELDDAGLNEYAIADNAIQTEFSQ